MPPRIGDHAIIGDGRSAALVARDGTITWLAWPRFDSDALFAAILDPEVGGSFRVAPTGRYASQRSYLPDTNVLETTFSTADGTMRVVDLMPVPTDASSARLAPERELLRLVECTEGEVELDVLFDARPGYGARGPRVRELPGVGLRFEDGRAAYTLRADVTLSPRDDGAWQGRTRLSAGDRRVISLSFDRDAPATLPLLGDHARERAAETAAFWRGWVRRCTYEGPHKDAVVRSLLAVELMRYAPSGGLIAAPTTSLPERIGGDSNYDYRFVWLRDASMTVRAFADLGYDHEAIAFTSWLLHTTRLTRPELRVLYDVYGRPPARERVLANLAGYLGSRPVRVNNAAADQLQLDIYGEVIGAVAVLHQRGQPLDRATQGLLRDLGRYVVRHWSEPDQGVWEQRGGAQHHTLSRVMCWSAMDRLLELHHGGAVRDLPADVLSETRARIRAEVETRGWSDELASYTQHLDGDTVDASLLLLGWHGFAHPRSPRMGTTFRRIRERLGAGPALYYRNEDYRRSGEGAFGIACFWAVELLARGAGALAAADAAMAELLRRANDVGLFGEEIDPATGQALGNFPQAYTHVGLLSAACALEERRSVERSRWPSAPPPIHARTHEVHA